MRSSTDALAAGWQRRTLHEGYQRGRDRRRKVRGRCAAVLCMILDSLPRVACVLCLIDLPKPQDSLFVIRGL